MKKIIRNFLFILILILLVSACKIMRIHQVTMDNNKSKEFGGFTPRPASIHLNSYIEAELEGADEIGVIVYYKCNTKNIAKEVAKLGGDYFECEPSTFVGTRQVWDGYSSTENMTTDYYKYEEGTWDGYYIHIFRKLPGKSNTLHYKTFQKCLQGNAYYEYKDEKKYCSAGVLKKCFEKGYKINTIDPFGVPYIYYLFDFFEDLYKYKSYQYKDEYERIETVVNEGADLNLVPDKIDFIHKLDIRLLRGEEGPYGSILKYLRKEMNDTESKHLYRDEEREYTSFLRKVDSLLVKNGALEFVGK